MPFSSVFTIPDKILGLFLPSVGEGKDPMGVDMSNVERVVGGTFKVLQTIDTITLGVIILLRFSNTDDLPSQDGSIRCWSCNFAGSGTGIVSLFKFNITGDEFVVLMTNIGKGIGGLIGGGFSESLSLLSELDGTNLIKVGAGIAAIGAGLVFRRWWTRSVGRRGKGCPWCDEELVLR